MSKIRSLLRKILCNNEGVITIEAAIAMPIFIITLFGFLYFVKVIYITDQIESAMTRSAHDMSNYGYILDRVALVDFQQDIYGEGQADVEQMKKGFQNIMNQGGEIADNAKEVSGLSMDTLDMSMDLSIFGGNTTLVEFAQQAKTAKDQIPNKIESIDEQVDTLLKDINSFVEEVASNAGSIASGELVEFVNGRATDVVAGKCIERYISDDQLERWGVSGDNGVIDFSDSSFMIYDDQVTLVARYKVVIPMFTRFIDGIHIYQSVTARAYTGSYDYDTDKKIFKDKKDNPEAIESEEMYYVSEKKDVECFHTYRCLRKYLYEGDYNDRVENYNQQVCKQCQAKSQLSPTGIVYFTSDTSRLHYTRSCTKVTSPEIKMVTLAEAEDSYRPCSKCLPNFSSSHTSEESDDDH